MGHERKRGKLEDLNALLRNRANERFSLVVGDTAPLAGVKYVITLDTDTERLVITPSEPLGTGTAELRITYRGRISDGLVGFYRSTYIEDGREVPIAVTQFEAPHARRAFPCWDEPEFKARFSLGLQVRSELFAVANGAEVSRTDVGDGWTEIRFAETIPISTYLVAWAIGRLEATDAVVVRDIPIRIVHRPGQGHLTSLALAAAAHAVAWYEDHFDIPFPGGKLDMVAVPDFAFWGRSRHRWAWVGSPA